VNRLIGAMWKHVQNHANTVYVIVTGAGGIPFIEPPYLPPEDEQPAEFDFEQEEAYLNVFSTLEGAMDYRRHLIEAAEERPSDLKAELMSLSEIWGRLDEITELAGHEFNSGVKIVLIHSRSGGEVVATDPLFSSSTQYN
jgi:hypothetical protein